MTNFVLSMVELDFFCWPNETREPRCKFDKNTVAKAVIGSGYGTIHWGSGMFAT